MKTFTLSEVNELARDRDDWCVSFYLPTHPSRPEGQQDAVRLRNLIDLARERLLERGLRSTLVREILRPVVDVVEDKTFWNGRTAGLAIFVSQGECVRLRLPFEVAEEVAVDRRFHIRQVLPLLHEDGQAYLLALSRNHVRVLAVTPHDFEAVAVKNLPCNLEEALNLAGADRGEQVHAGARGDRGKQSAVFHGQGGRPDTLKTDVKQFFRGVSLAMEEFLHGQRVPLLLAGVDYELAIFRDVCQYSHLAAAQLTGNFDHASDYELYQQARPLVEDMRGQPARDAARQYAATQDRTRVSDDLTSILPACFRGQVETLLLDPAAKVKGHFDPKTEKLDRAFETDAEDLLELAVVHTLRNGGNVRLLPPAEMPSQMPVAAILRYPATAT